MSCGELLGETFLKFSCKGADKRNMDNLKSGATRQIRRGGVSLATALWMGCSAYSPGPTRQEHRSGVIHHGQDDESPYPEVEHPVNRAFGRREGRQLGVTDEILSAAEVA
jgi:hypothetical protein